MNDYKQSDPSLDKMLRTHYQSYFRASHGSEPAPSEIWQQVSACLEPATVVPSRRKRWSSISSALKALPSLPRSHRAASRVWAVALSVAVGCILLIAVVFSAGGIIGVSHNQQRPLTSSATDTTALLTALIQSNPRTKNLSFTPLHLTKITSVGSVSLQQVSADTNNIVLGYDADTEDIAPQPTIKLSNGQVLKPIFVISNLKGKRMAVLADFNGENVADPDGNIQLFISIPTNHTTETFDPTVPFSSGKTVSIKQTVTSGDQKITLDRVVITPSETRFYYSTTEATPSAPAWQILAGGKTYSIDVYFVGQGDNFAGSLSTDLQTQAGPWTVTFPDGGELHFPIA